ncbi:TPA: IS3 family transposase [Legionella pneumophila]|uniref:IS3 family transposase n=1 Tax=Legionella pneumophila TaxID=446 RepID=UPI003775D970
MKKIAEENQYCYGCSRIKNALNTLGYLVGRRQTQILMNVAKVFCIIKWLPKATINNRFMKMF